MERRWSWLYSVKSLLETPNVFGLWWTGSVGRITSNCPASSHCWRLQMFLACDGQGVLVELRQIAHGIVQRIQRRCNQFGAEGVINANENKNAKFWKFWLVWTSFAITDACPSWKIQEFNNNNHVRPTTTTTPTTTTVTTTTTANPP
jgi:hypothetical protein